MSNEQRPDEGERASALTVLEHVDGGGRWWLRGRVAGDPDLAFRLRRPPGVGAAPLLVAVHGISRDPDAQIAALGPLADEHGLAIVAPEFSEPTWRDYQRLGRRGRGSRADLALVRLIEWLWNAGVANDEVFLFGYSGGGQFAHRFVLAHPEWVSAAIVAAPGWYTLPDPDVRYPYGLRIGGELPGIRPSLSALLRVPLLVAVGDRDTERDAQLRSSRRVDRAQGGDRVARARRFAETTARAAAARGLPNPVRLELLRGAHHSFEACIDAGLGRLIFRFIAEQRQRRGGARA